MTELQYFATLRPMNVLAKLAFNNVVECSNEASILRQSMILKASHTFDREALQFELKHKQRRSDDDTDTTSPTEVNTDTEQCLHERGMLWTGSYVLSFNLLPQNEHGLGWIIGKLGGQSVGLVLATNSSIQEYKLSIHGQHAHFNFSTDQAALFIAKANRSSTTQLSVGHNNVKGIHYMNQRSMEVRISSLEYDFCYVPFANEPKYYEELEKYLREEMPCATGIDQIQIPTPQGESKIFGDWTMGNALGRGVEGNVFLASSSCGDVATVKVIVRMRNNAHAVNSGVKNLETLTKLAKSHDERRIVQLKQAIYSRDTPEFDPAHPFDEVVLVLEPYLTSTLDIFIKTHGLSSKCDTHGMVYQTAQIFRDILLAVEFLHHHGWLHGDIKPQNVGISQAQSFYKVVLLDIGSSTFVDSQDATINPTPGHGGTVRYLAPERELRPYTTNVDVWSLGIIGFELMYGSHPWSLIKNPWRKGPGYEHLRHEFNKSYEEAMAQLSVEKVANQNTECLQVGLLLRAMLTYPWAKSNNKPRMSTSEALQHPSWSSLLDLGGDQPPKKRKDF